MKVNNKKIDPKNNFLKIINEEFSDLDKNKKNY